MRIMRRCIRSAAARTEKRLRRESLVKSRAKKFSKDDSEPAARGARGEVPLGVIFAPGEEGTRLETIGSDGVPRQRPGDGEVEPEISQEKRTDRRAFLSAGELLLATRHSLAPSPSEGPLATAKAESEKDREPREATTVGEFRNHPFGRYCDLTCNRGVLC